jgi:hypothetical protein
MPAFADEANVEATSFACQVCATYVTSGISKEVGTFSRVLKALTNVLDKIQGNLMP